MSGLELIAAEMERQTESIPGYFLRSKRELARAAMALVTFYVERAWAFTDELGLIGGAKNGPKVYRTETMPDSWPWAKKYWKPKTPLEDLVKAGALIAAEIDRLQRLSDRKAGE